MSIRSFKSIGYRLETENVTGAGGTGEARSAARPRVIGARFFSMVCGMALAGQVAAADPPDPAEILAQLRANQAAVERALAGRLRGEGATVPFELVSRPGRVEYRFRDPDEIVRLTLDEKGSRLERGAAGALRELDAAGLADRVRGTGISYEDLSLRFLYWPDPILDGEQIIGARRTWKIKLFSPTRASQYRAVIVWADQESAALMQMEGYDRDGKLVKRFRVVSGQKIEGAWFLKQMRLEGIDPATGKTVARWYIELEPPVSR